MPSSPSAPDGPLTSWKAIARFFDRDVRTVQRWEKEEGLPVHRHRHRRGNSVYADPEELRAWWSQQRADLTAQPAAAGRRVRPAAWVTRVGRRRPSARLAGALAGLVVVAAAGWALLTFGFDRGANRPIAIATISGKPDGSSASPPLEADVNGDGREDLILATHEAGRVYILFGGEAQPGSIDVKTGVEVAVREGIALDVPQAGDFNGDGIDDLLLTERLFEPASFTANGSSYLLWGRRDWPKRMALPETAGVVLHVDWPTNAGLGGCVSGRGGDLDGDGLDDVVLGGGDYGTPERRSAGGILVLFGRRTWPRTIDAIAAADVTIDGADTGEALGTHCAVGDFDGDGRADLAAIALEHTLWFLRGVRSRTYLFRSREPWPRRMDARSMFDLRIDGIRPKLYGPSLALTDITGDGKDDIVLTRWKFYDAPPVSGELRVFFGGERRGVVTDEAADVVVQGADAHAGLGQAIAVGDLDGDGIRDLVTSEAAGAVHVLYGRREWRPRGTVADHGGVELISRSHRLSAYYLDVWTPTASSRPALVLVPAAEDPGAQEVMARVAETHRRVALDVRPGYEPNVLLPDWVCVARVFGFSGAPADAIDPSTLRLAGAPATQVQTADYNGDGLEDVQAMFDTARMKLGPEMKNVWVLGRTRGGLPLAGTDAIVFSSAHATPASGEENERVRR
jgi:hypothetical protein